MRPRLIAIALLLTLAFQPSFAAVCATDCAMPMAESASAHRAVQSSMTGHHHHNGVSHAISGDSAPTVVSSCGKTLEVAAPAKPLPQVELLSIHPMTVLLVSIRNAVKRPPLRSLSNSVPVHVPLRI